MGKSKISITFSLKVQKFDQTIFTTKPCSSNVTLAFFSSKNSTSQIHNSLALHSFCWSIRLSGFSGTTWMAIHWCGWSWAGTCTDELASWDAGNSRSGSRKWSDVKDAAMSRTEIGRCRVTVSRALCAKPMGSGTERRLRSEIDELLEMGFWWGNF